MSKPIKNKTKYKEMIVILNLDTKKYNEEVKLRALELEIWEEVNPYDLTLNATFVKDDEDIFAFSHIVIDKKNKTKAYIWIQQERMKQKSSIIIPKIN